MTSPASTTDATMTPAVYDMLREAVSIARHDGIRSVAALRMRLLENHPGADETVTAAIKAWATQVAAAGQGGLS